MLEVASGTGEHAAYFAAALPWSTWQPSDPDPASRASIDSHCLGLANVRTALALDAAGVWPNLQADIVLCINMVHISPWAATLGLVAGAAGVLQPGGRLILYGPYLEHGETAPSNHAFDARLRGENPAWGLRDLSVVTAAAHAAGFAPPLVERMPANNLLVSYKR